MEDGKLSEKEVLTRTTLGIFARMSNNRHGPRARQLD